MPPWPLLWYVLAGFILGFAVSLLWEWAYFRGRRLAWHDAEIERLQGELRQAELHNAELRNAELRADLRTDIRNAVRSDVRSERSSAYQSPPVFLDSEEAEALHERGVADAAPYEPLPPAAVYAARSQVETPDDESPRVTSRFPVRHVNDAQADASSRPSAGSADAGPRGQEPEDDRAADLRLIRQQTESADERAVAQRFTAFVPAAEDDSRTVAPQTDRPQRITITDADHDPAPLDASARDDAGSTHASPEEDRPVDAPNADAHVAALVDEEEVLDVPLLAWELASSRRSIPTREGEPGAAGEEEVLLAVDSDAGKSAASLPFVSEIDGPHLPEHDPAPLMVIAEEEASRIEDVVVEGEDLPLTRSASEPALAVSSSAHPDNLQLIDGIGPAYMARLNAGGIFTFHQLAMTSDETLQSLSRALPTAKPGDWAKQASALAAEYDRAGAAYAGPPPDNFRQLRGIDAESVQRLYGAGIYTLADLARQTSATLGALIPEREESALARWIARAAALGKDKEAVG
ncbi:MAG: hypothetical protein H6642_16855 [Caldilineaceae bacterium]|nr:hypothetical protein [Caldilineaceae bacterium]